MGIYISTYIEP